MTKQQGPQLMLVPQKVFFPKKNKKYFSKESNIGCGVTEVIRDTGRHGVSLSASNMEGNNSIEGSEGYKNCSLLSVNLLEQFIVWTNVLQGPNS